MKIENEPAAKEAETLTGDALTIAFLKANLEDLRTGGIVTVAMTNPNVMSYMEHWEGRAEKAEKRVEELEATLRAHNSDSAEPVAFSDYDEGLLSDYGGGNVDWWMDYIRAEIGRANEFWRVQVEVLASPPAKEVEIEKIGKLLDDLIEEAEWKGMNEQIGWAAGDPKADEDRKSVAGARNAVLAALTNRTPDDEVGNG